MKKRMVKENKRGKTSLSAAPINQHRGQVTLFVIVGILIVVLAILTYLFYPKIVAGLGLGSQSPSQFMETCIGDDIKEAVHIASYQGGSINPEHYILYKNEKIEYLCYTGEYYKTCVMQQPMLKQHIENEVRDYISATARKCLDDLKASYENKGYTVSMGMGGIQVELLPERIVTTFNNSLVLTKTDTQRFNSLKVVVNNNLYEMVGIADSILNFEARLGDSETTTYMNYYHWLKVEKIKQSDGSTIYILTERDNPKNKLQFASRSLAWPPGYGISGVMY